MRHLIIHADLLAKQHHTGVEVYLSRLIDGLRKYGSPAFRYWVWYQGAILALEDFTPTPPPAHRRPAYFFPRWEYPLWDHLPKDIRSPLMFEPHYFIHQYKIPSIVSIFDLSCFDRPADHPWHRVLKHHLAIPHTLTHARAILALSQFTKHRILSHWPALSPDKIHICHPGLDPTEFKAPPQKRQKSILLVGTLEPRKGITDILPTLTDFLHLHPDWQIWHAGKPSWTPSGHNTRPSNHSIKHFGYVTPTQLKTLYATCGLVLFPSHYEGFGYPVLEALATQTPCIVRNIPALTEWIPPNIPRFTTPENLLTLLVHEETMFPKEAKYEMKPEFTSESFAHRFETYLMQTLL